MNEPPPVGGLTARHVGPLIAVTAAWESVVRHREAPPAQKLFRSFGSRRLGGMKLARLSVSVMTNGAGFGPLPPSIRTIGVAPPSLLRKIRRFWVPANMLSAFAGSIEHHAPS